MLRLTSFGDGDHAACSACSWPGLLVPAAVLGHWHLVRGPDPWRLSLASVLSLAPVPAPRAAGWLSKLYNASETEPVLNP